MNSEMLALRDETADLSAEGLLRVLLDRYGDRVALASSLSAEDQVLTDMLCRLSASPRIFTIDTGRLPQETHDLIEQTSRRYGLRIEVLFPERREVEELVRDGGPNAFRHSVEARRHCCHVRKVQPLLRRLAGLDAWITGLRREQSSTRADLERIEWDETHGKLKANPLADWSAERVWEHIRRHDVPYSVLHDRGYPSIGCAPCTRAVAAGEDIRAGRWWWELPEHKECGLHVVDGRLVRRARTGQVLKGRT